MTTCPQCARLQARIDALEAKVLYQHAVLTHLWDATQLDTYIKSNHSTTLGTGPTAARRLQLLALLPTDKYLRPSEIPVLDETGRRPTSQRIDDLHCLLALGYAERKKREAPTAGRNGREPRPCYIYRRTHAGTVKLEQDRAEIPNPVEPSPSARPQEAHP
jgi:hypothetical protein